jgi:hypothetical protein
MGKAGYIITLADIDRAYRPTGEGRFMLWPTAPGRAGLLLIDKFSDPIKKANANPGSPVNGMETVKPASRTLPTANPKTARKRLQRDTSTNGKRDGVRPRGIHDHPCKTAGKQRGGIDE